MKTIAVIPARGSGFPITLIPFNRVHKVLLILVRTDVYDAVGTDHFMSIPPETDLNPEHHVIRRAEDGFFLLATYNR